MSTHTSRRVVVRPDARRRFVIQGANPDQDYAIDSLPDGSFLVSPCIIRTTFEAWVDERIPNAAEQLAADGTHWEQLPDEVDALALGDASADA